jgi:hypothetical protein
MGGDGFLFDQKLIKTVEDSFHVHDFHISFVAEVLFDFGPLLSLPGLDFGKNLWICDGYFRYDWGSVSESGFFSVCGFDGLAGTFEDVF